jgi:hypothetical protein
VVVLIAWVTAEITPCCSGRAERLNGEEPSIGSDQR